MPPITQCLSTQSGSGATHTTHSQALGSGDGLKWKEPEVAICDTGSGRPDSHIFEKDSVDLTSQKRYATFEKASQIVTNEHRSNGSQSQGSLKENLQVAALFVAVLCTCGLGLHCICETGRKLVADGSNGTVTANSQLHTTNGKDDRDSREKTGISTHVPTTDAPKEQDSGWGSK